MSSPVEIVSLSRNSRDVGRFLDVSYRIYERDPYWVAPLLSDLKKVFTDANPLFEHAKMQLWVARQGGKDVGRIAGVIDSFHAKHTNEPAAFFGFYECIDDPDASAKLFNAVCEWGKAANLRRIIGPMNPTTNDECGLLVHGFDSSPVFMMPYNPEYYVRLVESAGFRKAKDLLAFHFDLSVIPLDRLRKIAGKLRQRNPTLSFRPIKRSTLQQDLGKVKEVYNAAWQENWGFIPMTDAEVDFMAERLKPLLMEGLVWLAEDGPEPVAFLLATPDFNVPIKPLRGKLCTPRLLGFIPYVLGWKRPPRTRVLTLGVKHTHRNRGLESALLIEGLDVGIRAGFTESEASWILEDNVAMSRVLESIGGRPYKTYRIYERSL